MSGTKHVCKHCGKEEDGHCVFELLAIPKGCVCNPQEWGGDIDPICKRFVWAEGTICERCEHDEGCHVRKE